jgi:membrane protein YdbS with pleckstrin-like domain
LDIEPGDFYREFHPSRAYLHYLKVIFWIVAIASDIAIFTAWIIITIVTPPVGMFLAIPALVLAFLPDILGYIAIHLRYDTMWYVMNDRTLRTRRGIWEILEHTITFENVQNVSVVRGPIQQLFGFSTIVVETAGATNSDGQSVHAVGNKVIMQGIDNPEEIRALIMDRVRQSRTTGLGDEPKPIPQDGWTLRHRQLLRDIRDEVVGDSI